MPRKDRAVDDCAGCAARERTDPVNAVIGPVPGSQRRPKHASRVHRRPGEWAAKQGCSRNEQPDGHARHGRTRARTVVGSALGRREEGEHQEHGQQALDQHSGRSRESVGQIRRSQRYRAPGFFRNHRAQQIGARRRRRPIARRSRSACRRGPICAWPNSQWSQRG